MKKIINIFTGWFKSFGWISVSTAEGKLSELRLKICGECEKGRPSAFLKVMNGEMETVHTTYCTICRCPCLQKSLVIDEKCPIKKW